MNLMISAVSEQSDKQPDCSSSSPETYFLSELPSLLPKAMLKIFEVLSITICEEEERHDSFLIRLAVLENNKQSEKQVSTVTKTPLKR